MTSVKDTANSMASSTGNKEILPLNEAELKSVVELALSQAAKNGANQAEASASTGDGLSINVRMGELETIEHTRDRGLVVSVYFGNSSGSASTSE